jgi:hypothetical protein
VAQRHLQHDDQQEEHPFQRAIDDEGDQVRRRELPATRSISSGSIGCTARRSTATNPATPTIPTSAATTTTAEPTPRLGRSTIAHVAPANPAVARTAPAGSQAPRRRLVTALRDTAQRQPRRAP